MSNLLLSDTETSQEEINVFSIDSKKKTSVHDIASKIQFHSSLRTNIFKKEKTRVQHSWHIIFLYIDNHNFWYEVYPLSSTLQMNED